MKVYASIFARQRSYILAVLIFCPSIGLLLYSYRPAGENNILPLSSLFLIPGLTSQNGIVLARRLGEIVRFSTDKGSCGFPVFKDENKINLPGITEFSDPITEKPEFQKNSYARQLRAMGQALEERHVFSLDLELKGDLYVVRGKITAADYAQSSFSGFIQHFVSGVGSV